MDRSIRLQTGWEHHALPAMAAAGIPQYLPQPADLIFPEPMAVKHWTCVCADPRVLIPCPQYLHSAHQFHPAGKRVLFPEIPEKFWRLHWNTIASGQV